jgi:hypothetical protein
MSRIYLGLFLGTVLTACGGFSLDTYWRSGAYILIAVDTRGQMNLAIDDRSGLSSALVGPTVFSIGANEKYIVVKQHPSKDASGGFDRSVTNYFIVDRTVGTGLADRQKSVRGPLSEEVFNQISVTQSLPAFTKTIDDLK